MIDGHIHFAYNFTDPKALTRQAIIDVWFDTHNNPSVSSSHKSHSLLHTDYYFTIHRQYRNNNNETAEREREKKIQISAQLFSAVQHTQYTHKHMYCNKSNHKRNNDNGINNCSCCRHAACLETKIHIIGYSGGQTAGWLADWLRARAIMWKIGIGTNSMFYKIWFVCARSRFKSRNPVWKMDLIWIFNQLIFACGWIFNTHKWFSRPQTVYLKWEKKNLFSG